MSKDFDYIKELFDADDVRAPESLSEEKMLSMLKEADNSMTAQAGSADKGHDAEPARRSVRRRALKWAALAACAVIAVFGIPALYNSALFDPDTSVRGGELYTFKSESEINRLVRRLGRSTTLERFNMKGGGVTDIAVEESADFETNTLGDTGAAAPAGSDASHSETYLQVEDVDEADIVKTDGRYIYYVNDKKEVVILEASGGKTKKVSTIGSTGIENYIRDIYLKGDTLIAIGKVYNEDHGYTAVVSYDIKDRSKPTLISEFRQSGDDIVSSRMVGDFVYLVTNTYVYKEDNRLPMCTVDGEYRSIPVQDISCVPDPSYASYVILSAVDISSGKSGRSKTKAVFGASDDIYCNNHNLYVAVSEWDDSLRSESTRIVRASLDGLKIKFNGTCVVRGHIDNQFSMDEKEGYFRIATTSDRDGMDVNNLFILDDNLKETGSVTGFARNESIKAVRFIGSKAYVITYEAIDPLFIIDLADPANPRIEGEVKIDGFSTLLIPVPGDKLLGIGHATGDIGYGGEYASGLKLALFDISDPSEPRVIDSKEFKDMSSPAQETHLALTVNSEQGYFAIPYDVYSYDDLVMIEDGAEDAEDEADTEERSENEHGVLVFGTEKAIDIYDRHKLGNSQIMRSVFIDDFIYALDPYGYCESFRATPLRSSRVLP